MPKLESTVQPSPTNADKHLSAAATGPSRGATGRSRRLARDLISYLWPRGHIRLKLQVVAAVLLVLASKLVAAGAPLLYKMIVDRLSAPGAALVPVALIVAYAAAHVGAQLSGALRRFLFVEVAQRATRHVALALFEHLHRLSLRFHLDRKTGGVSRVVQRGTTSIEYLLDLILFNAVPTTFELLLVGAVLARLYSGWMAAVLVGTMLAYAAYSAAVARWQVRLRRTMNEWDVAASVAALDSLLNYETVKFFTAEAQEALRYGESRRRYQHAAVRSAAADAAFAAGQAAIVAVGLVAVMLAAGQGVAARTLGIGDFVLVVSYLLQLYGPLGTLGGLYSSFRQSLADVEMMMELLAVSPEVEDEPGAQAIAVTRGHVVFDGVSFAYDARRPILSGISFEVRPGATVALVGPTGGGKSTIARLLLRFYDVTGGRILIDGQDIRAVTQSSLRGAIGVVPQDTILFNESLAYNIAYGRPGATPSEVEEAARLARLDEFIRRLPDGYDTPVGERGLKLSGGEKQRVAIARVILKRPPLLVFDEATSALDNRTERDIQASLRAASAGVSTLVIAHRLSTIVEADEILVIDGGRIAERGTHAALLARNGLYRVMWQRQQRGDGETIRHPA